MKPLFLVMLVSLGIAYFWNSVPIISQSVHSALDPSAGKLLAWNVSIGMLLFSAVISIFLTLIQKYATDQKMLREIKKEQKFLQEEAKKFKEHPEKFMEIQKKSWAKTLEILPLTMRPIMYTSIPIILFFRWFSDYFIINQTKVFGMHWLLAYIIFSMILTSIFRKMFNVA